METKEIIGFLIIFLIILTFAGFVIVNSYIKNILLLTGFALLFAGIINSKQKCPEKEIIYRNVPRSFREEQENQIPVSELFNDMFSTF